MTRIQLDKVLEYLATGEDEKVILGALPFQPDARSLLVRAQTALDLLSGDQIGKGVRERVARLRAALSEGPPAFRMVSKSVAPSREGQLKFMRSVPQAMRVPVQSDVFFSQSEPRSPMAGPFRAGASQVDRLRAVDVRKDAIGPRETTVLGSPAPYLLASARYEGLGEADRGRARQMPPEAGPYQAPMPGGGTLQLSWEADKKGAKLIIQILGSTSSGAPIPVTWLPEKGKLIRAYTDGAGVAVLPRLARGRGVLRIDAERTVEIELHVLV